MKSPSIDVIAESLNRFFSQEFVQITCGIQRKTSAASQCIKSSDITSSSITLNGNSATLNSNIEKTRITNGFKYKLTVTGTSTDGDTSLHIKYCVIAYHLLEVWLYTESLYPYP